MKNIYYLTPSSFCFGVKRAINELEKIIKKYPNDEIFCIHELVHNPNVNNRFKKLNIKFVENQDRIPTKDCIVIFSAHWINREILHKAEKKFKIVYNLECPLVTKIYKEIDGFLEKWINTFFYIWKAWHQEAQNILDYMNYRKATIYNFLNKENIPNIEKEKEFAVLSQTTLNFKKIEKLLNQIKTKYPKAIFPQISDICKATYERQEIINQNVEKFETLIIIWWKNSSNTKELVKIWKKHNKQTFFAESLKDLIQNNQNIFQHTDELPPPQKT